MTKRALAPALTAVALILGLAPAAPGQVSQQIGVGDTGLIFGGIDAEGGIGDWYVSNGVVEAIIDQTGIQSDLTPLVPGNEPPLQSEINETGGSLLDVGLVGQNDDHLAQMFTVGGLSTANFILYDTVSAPSPGTVRATGKLLFPPFSPRSAPCVDVVTDYVAAGADPFLTVTTTATNNCGVTLTGFGGFLDVFIWTQRGPTPFSGGGAALGGFGFRHPVLDLSNPATALELPTFMSTPGHLDPADGVVDPAHGTVSGAVSYGLLGVEVVADADGGGPGLPVSAAVNNLFGVSSTLISALGNQPNLGAGGNVPGATLTYTRRVYVGGRNDVASTATPMIAELASRGLFSTGTISGDVDAADDANVEATLLVTRLGRCTGAPAQTCKTNADCTGVGTCADPVVTPGQAPGAAMTQVRTDAAGAFTGVALPAGDYEVVVASAERDDVVVSPVTVPAAGNTPLTIPPMSARGTVLFTVREKKAGLPHVPAKITFKGTGLTPDPRFNRDYTVILGSTDQQAETFGGTQAGTGGAVGQSNVVYTAGTGQGGIQIRPGTYDVYASRGNEYTVQRESINVSPGGTVTLDFRLKRVLKTKNAMSADFHVHSGRSLDTTAGVRDRVLSFAAEGVEVMVSTDHDKHIDYAPLIASLSLAPLMTSVVGDEVTGSVPNPPAWPNSIGHVNAWPLVVQPDAPRDGAVQDEYVAPNWAFSRLRNAGAQVVQYNHPRAGVSGITSIGIFNNIGCGRCANAIDTLCTVDADCPAAPAPQDCTCVGYQPDRPITMPPNDVLLDDGVLGPGSPANPDGFDNLAFDVMEILNGNRNTDFPGIRQIRRDWLSLLNQGIFRPGTGVSDSHRITVEHAGWARTYVNGVGDDPAAMNVATMNTQVKAGNILISGGPYIEFSAKATNKNVKAGMGGTVPVTNGKVRLGIKVSSPAWMPIEEVRLIANGFVVASFDGTTQPRVKPVPANFESSGGIRRFSANLTRLVAQDTYFVVEAGPKLDPNPSVLPVPPPIVDIVEPDVVPIAITNPIFVDTNGNMTFDPPGLPVLTARAPAAPDEAPGFLAAARRIVDQVLAGLRGEVVASDLPGEMTGVTDEQKAEAAREGRYVPLHELSLPADAVAEALRKAEDAERRRLEESAAGR